MAYYRVYLLDATDRVFEGKGIESNSDITAITVAAEAARKFAVEVWEGVRKVAYLPAEGAEVAAHRSGAAGWGSHLATMWAK
jgi:hypothetical protein